MSKKEDLLNNFRQAKVKHERWISYADAIYNGIQIGEEHTPISHTDCAFGEWLLNNGQIIYHIKSASNLSEDHKALHVIYMKLYKDMNKDIKGNIFNKSKMEKLHKEELEKDIQALHTMSKTVMDTLGNMIDEVNAMSDSKVENLYN